jgi:hypothetical protein
VNHVCIKLSDIKYRGKENSSQELMQHRTEYKKTNELGTVAHVRNPRYSGVRDQKDHGLRPAQAKN